jgi:hypothetical protein
VQAQYMYSEARNTQTQRNDQYIQSYERSTNKTKI